LTQPTIDQIWEKKGNFLDTSTGAVVAQPEGWFPIVAGVWPNPNVGARQVRCSCCNSFAGISPNGWSVHILRPEERPIFCPPCFEQLLVEIRGEW
jgi:hypothetical protein